MSTHTQSWLHFQVAISKAPRKSSGTRPHLWVWTTHFSQIRDKLKELTSQEVRGLKIKSEAGHWEELGLRPLKGRQLRNVCQLSAVKREGLGWAASEVEPEPSNENLRKTNISWTRGRNFCQICPNATWAASGWSEFPVLRDVQGQDICTYKGSVTFWSLPTLRFCDTWFCNFYFLFLFFFDFVIFKTLNVIWV